MDGISSILDTSKVKHQWQEIEILKHEKHEPQQDIEGLTQTIHRERQQKTMRLKAEVHKINDWLPDTLMLMKWGMYCKNIGFTKNQTRDIISMKPFSFHGRIVFQRT